MGRSHQVSLPVVTEHYATLGTWNKVQLPPTHLLHFLFSGFQDLKAFLNAHSQTQRQKMGSTLEGRGVISGDSVLDGGSPSGAARRGGEPAEPSPSPILSTGGGCGSGSAVRVAPLPSRGPYEGQHHGSDTLSHSLHQLQTLPGGSVRPPAAPPPALGANAASPRCPSLTSSTGLAPLCTERMCVTPCLRRLSLSSESASRSSSSKHLQISHPQLHPTASHPMGPNPVV